MRQDRSDAQMRPVSVQRGFTEMTPGSVLIGIGKTRVLCTVSFDEDVPPWMLFEQQFLYLLRNDGFLQLSLTKFF